MTVEGAIGSAGLGWTAGKLLDALSAPLKNVLSEIELNRAITSALERSEDRLKSELAAEDWKIVSETIQQHQPLVFTVALETLHRRTAGTGMQPLREALSARIAQDTGLSKSLAARLAGILDDELWSKPPLSQHRQALAIYLQEAKLDLLVGELVPDRRLSAVHDRVRLASRQDRAKRLDRVHQSGPIIPRRLERVREDGAETLLMPDVAALFAPQWVASIVDLGGAGKSTTLFLLADAIETASENTAVIVLPMAEVALKSDVFEAIAKRDAFMEHKVTQADLAALARAGDLVILFDGWNELPPADRKTVRDAISHFHQDYEHAPLCFATRPSWFPLPVPPKAQFDLDRLSYADREHFVREVAGESGVTALRYAQQRPALRRVLGTPFFLSIFARLPWSDSDRDIPQTAAALIGAFVDEEFARMLQRTGAPAERIEVLRGLLEALANEMVETNRLDLSWSRVSEIIEPFRKRSGVAAFGADTQTILEEISLQSFVHVDEDSGARTLAFDHQMLRDWFASSRVAFEIEACSADGNTPCKAIGALGNQRSWEGALEIAVEQMSQDGPASPGLQRFLMEMCGVDVAFAGKLIGVLGNEAWQNISGAITSFVDEWAEETDPEALFDFMISTGRADFSERIWKDLEQNDDHRRRGGLTGRRPFNPAILGTGWRDRFRTLPEETRRSVIHDLCYMGGEVGLRSGLELALGEPKSDALGFVLDELHYRSRSELARELFEKFSDDHWSRWALDSRVSALAAEKARDIYEPALIRQIRADDPSHALRAKLTWCAMTGEPLTQEDIKAGLDLDEKDKENRHWFASRFREIAPDLLSDVMLRRYFDGNRIYRPEDYVRDLSERDEQRLLRLLGEQEEDVHNTAGLTRLLKAGSLRQLIKRAFDLRNQMQGLSRQEAAPLWREIVRIRDYLARADHDTLIRVLINTRARSGGEASILFDFVLWWKGDAYPEQGGLKPTGLQQLALGLQARRWCRAVLDDPNRSREWLADGARAVARIGRLQDLSLLKELLDTELNQHQAEQAEFLRLPPARRRRSTAQMHYDNLMRQAFYELRSPETCNILLDYFGDERFEISAAIALRPYAPFRTADIVDKGRVLGGPSNELLRRRRRAWIERPETQQCHPVAARLLDRVAEIDVQSEGGWSRIRQLATSAAWMDCGPRIREIWDVIERNPEPGKASELLEALSHTGHPLKAAWITRGLDAAEDKYFSQKWRPDNDFYILRPWLEMLSRCDDPMELVRRIEKYPESVKRWRVRDYVGGVIADDKDVEMDTVEALAAQGSDEEGTYARVNALFRIGSDRALETLLEDAMNGRHGRHLHFFGHGPNALSEYLAKKPDRFVALVDDLLTRSDGDARLTRLSSIVDGLDSPVLFEIAMERAVKSGEDAWKRLVAKMLPDQCILREPIGQSGYELTQKPLAALRQRIFHLSRTSDGDFWREQLARIDAIIGEYGGSPDDPRHPDLASGVPHPATGENLWYGPASDHSPSAPAS